MEEKRQRAVPKFSSFKPVPPPEESTKKDDGVRDKERDRERKRSRDRHRDRDRSRDRSRDWERRREKDRERDRHHDKHRHRDHDRHRHRHDRSRERHRERSRERDRDRDHGRDRHHDRACDTNTKPSISQPGPGDPFILDKYGDPLIVEYGTNERSKVPIYRRFGAGRIIGSRGFVVLDRDSPKEPFTIRLPGDGASNPSAFRDKALIAAANRRVSRLIKPSSTRPPTSDDLDPYIPLTTSRKRKRRDTSSSSSDNDDISYPDYRSIHGKAQPSDFRHSSSSSDSDSDSDSQSPSLTTTLPITPAKSRSLELNSHLKSHPADLPAWLELISLQNRLFIENRPNQDSTTSASAYGSQPPLNPDERAALAELKISLYRDALTAAANATPQQQQQRGVYDPHRERLLLGMLREAAVVWDEARLAREWEEVVGRYSPSSSTTSGTDAAAWFGLWRGRLDFEMRRAGGFEVEKVKGLMVRKLAELGAALERREGMIGELCRQAVYVFLRATRLLWDAGFGERAVAAWQAMLEMVFCRPTMATAGVQSPQSAVESFAEFWESEVPRIGEEGARGWRAFVEEGGADVADLPEQGGGGGGGQVNLPDAAPTSPFEAWAAAEKVAETQARMPARTLDEGAEDDPFRVVLFADIRDLLVWFPAEALDSVKPMLVEAFLVFCGLPTAGLADGRFAPMLDDPFVARHRVHGLDQALSGEPEQTEEDSESEDSDWGYVRPEPQFGGHGGCIALSPEVLIASPYWFRYLEKWPDTPAERRVDLTWALQTLGYLVKQCGMESAAEYYLALEWVNAPAGTRKVAKALLKRYNSNVRLYNTYALIEEFREGKDSNPNLATKILSSAMDLPSPPAEAQLLWNTWAWLAFEAFEYGEVLWHLSLSVDKEANIPANGSRATRLKTRTQLATARDFSLASQQLEAAEQYTESLMLLDYTDPILRDGGPKSKPPGNIDRALAIVDHFSKELESRGLSTSIHHERLLQAAARVLYLHSISRHGPYKPSEFQSHLTAWARLFPRNAIFPTLLRFWSSGPAARLNDPVRALFHEQLHPTNHADSPAQQHRLRADRFITHLLAIRHESLAGTAHSVRAAFEAALLPHNNNNIDDDIEYDGNGTSGPPSSSPELWVSYLRFCCRQYADSVSTTGSTTTSNRKSSRSGSNKDSSKKSNTTTSSGTKPGSSSGTLATAAKNLHTLFYRAVGACPWSKDVHMLAFTEPVLRTAVLSETELRAVGESMLARGLRVSVELGEVLERWERERKEG